MSTETKTENKLNPALDKQSKYGLAGARELYDRTDAMPSQYVGISDPRQQGMNQIMGVAGQRMDPLQQGVAYGSALPEWQKTLSGGYLNANPYIDDIVGRSAQQAGASQVGGFATGGRFGSGAMANAIADSTMATASNLYGANYQNERNRMMTALGQTGAMDQLQFADRNRQIGERNRLYSDAERMQGVGQQYEQDELSLAQEEMRQYMNPYMQQQMFEGSLSTNPLNRAGTVIQTKEFDWGGAMTSLGGAAMMGSDRALKKNITQVGESKSGIPEYTFEYIDADTPGVWHGVMAQDLLDTHPAAVGEHPSGYFTVNYTLLDTDFYRVR